MRYIYIWKILKGRLKHVTSRVHPTKYSNNNISQSILNVQSTLQHHKSTGNYSFWMLDINQWMEHQYFKICHMLRIASCHRYILTHQRVLQTHRRHRGALLSKFTQPQRNEVEKLKQTSPVKSFLPLWLYGNCVCEDVFSPKTANNYKLCLHGKKLFSRSERGKVGKWRKPIIFEACQHVARAKGLVPFVTNV